MSDPGNVLEVDYQKWKIWETYMMKNNVIPVRNLKQPLNHELVLEKVHRAIKFNQEAWLKPYINMKTELKKWKK